ncbi:glutaredoxin family protein [Caldilinea sp.]|uniref:glutaredoxin family protein n=1 Tax=Caldilinea sp. TaxID=2293560 RepID=UPI00260977B4|nr:thioredoxin family protein [uncultured Caldilinea sp.]
MKVEVFSADCRLCDRTIALLQERFPSLSLIVHRSSECRDGSCCKLAAHYGVRAVPTIVVDGEIVQVGLPDEGDLHLLAERLR